MRGLPVLLVVIFTSAASPVAGAVATISLETPGSTFVPGGGGAGRDANVVQWSQLGVAFQLDLVVTADTGMTAFGITLDGDSSLCYQAMTTHTLLGQEYIDNYNGLAGWDARRGVATWLDAGCLPMGGPDDEEITTLADETAGLASNGLAAYLVFTTPAPQGWAGCCIDALAGSAFVADGNYQPMAVTVVPLCIVPEPSGAALCLATLAVLLRRRECPYDRPLAAMVPACNPPVGAGSARDGARTGVRRG